MMLSPTRDSRNARDVDDGRRIAGLLLRRGREEREEQRRREKDGDDVGAVHVQPVVERVLGELLRQSLGALLAFFSGTCRARDASVVDEDMDGRLLALDLLDDLLDAPLVRDVALDGDQAAGGVTVDLGSLLERLKTATDDVDFGAIGGQRLRALEADACAATRDDGNLVGKAEELARR